MEPKTALMEEGRSGPPVEPGQSDGAAPRRGRKWNLSVVASEQLTPRMRRVRIGGEELGEFECKPAQEIILFLASGSEIANDAITAACHVNVSPTAVPVSHCVTCPSNPRFPITSNR